MFIYLTFKRDNGQFYTAPELCYYNINFNPGQKDKSNHIRKKQLNKETYTITKIKTNQHIE